MVEVIYIILGTILVYFIYYIFGRLFRFMEIRSLTKKGRTILWKSALSKIIEGKGFLVKTYSTVLPGKVWLLETNIEFENKSKLYDAVETNGFLVLNLPRNWEEKARESSAQKILDVSGIIVFDDRRKGKIKFGK